MSVVNILIFCWKFRRYSAEIMFFHQGAQTCIVNSRGMLVWQRLLILILSFSLQVGRGAGLVIERLRNFGSTPDAVARRCVFEKDT